MKKIVILLFLLVILGGLYFYKYFIPSDKNDAEQIFKIGDAAIYVPDQRPGSIVNIGFASLKKSGYIVIHENNYGNLGNILGNSRILSPGELKNISINLIRSTIHGESLFAVIYENYGDEAFYPSIDVPLKDQDGNIIFMRFNVDRGASLQSEINI